MPLTNNLKQQVDQPVFEWMRFAPTATSSLSALAASDDGSSRVFYYIIAQALWAYDTYSDSWMELAPPPVLPVTAVALKYSAFAGHRGHVISGTANTLRIGSVGRTNKNMVGKKIRIIKGEGSGQERTITSVADPIIHDIGLATTATANTLGDNTKKWRFNQWDGYTARTVFGTGAGQIRTIQYNDQTVLSVSDANYQAIDSFNNTGFSAVAPYAVPGTTAGLQAHFTIESVDLTLDTNWTVQPDATSQFQIISGGLWLLSSAAAAPWTTFNYYDILTDTWQVKTAIGGQLLAAFGTDFSMERTGEIAGAFLSGLTATSGGGLTLANSGATMDFNRWANSQIRIVGGTGVGQRRRISGNTDTTFFVADKWDITPDNTSQYEVYGNTNRIYVIGNASSTMWNYSVEDDLWANGQIVDTGIARNIAVFARSTTSASYGSPHESFGITSIVRTTSGILTVAVNAAGSGYQVGDLVTCSTTGTLGTAFVTSVNTTGGVTGLQLAAAGSGYVGGSTNTTGGAGSGLTITITVGTTALVTTAMNHDLRTGDPIRIQGCATDPTFNADFVISGVGGLTTFSIAAPSSTGSPTAANSQSVTVLVDASKNWNTNSLVGRLVHINVAGPAPTTQSRRITANTATTITLQSAITAAVNGTSRYIIQEVRSSGAMITEQADNLRPYGYATSATATTLVDTSKNWTINQWQGHRVRIISGTGEGNEEAITANTQTTLTVASWSVATPDATSKYEIMDSFGLVTTAGAALTITDAAKKWKVNVFAGKRGRITSGTGAGTDFTVTSNTATVLTVGANITTGVDSTYTIYDIQPRSTGTSMNWLYGLTDTTKKGRWLICPRGGGSTSFDVFDIPTETWYVHVFTSPASITLSTGSMYAYDGGDSYYFTKDATNRIYEIDLRTWNVYHATSIPYVHGAATLGNKMEIVKTVDGLKYIYVMRHTGQEMWRTLKFW